MVQRNQLPLAAIQAEIWRQNPYPGHVGQVQGIPPTKSRWLTSFCRHLLGKAQEGILAPAGGSSRLGSLLGVLASGLLRVWFRCNSKRRDHNLMLPGEPKTFCLGSVTCPRPWSELLERGYRENRQRKGKDDAPIFLHYLRHRLKVSPRE